jgi:tetratricopeptide (TPR) repeat protein
MAEISLRAYIEYIDDRLDRDAYGEVMAQCRHILETYPKYIEVYKQLARALAAQENYTDAMDMFQRVLSSDPTDFVSHIGMSECYKEDGVLDQAIWHLERAFEQVPSNSELQEALKQLYEQRDHKVPRKIQMSGGALAQMYMRGKLYPQAISELTKAIAHDPNRLDLQILMAESLWYDHQYVAAGKVAAEVLKKLPYSISSNRILAQLWLHAGQPKEARPFLERVKELDPYLGYEFEHDGQTASADAFRLLMLDYTTVQTATDRGDVADWVAEIDGIEKRTDVTGPLSAPAAALSDVFAPPAGAPPKAVSEAPAPDWLQDALQATGSTPAGAAATPGSLAGAEPDWLRDALTGPGPQAPAPLSDSAPDWLHDAIGQPTPPPLSPVPSPTENEPDWLKDVLGGTGASQPPAADSSPASAPEGDAPDWLRDALVQETPAQTSPAPPTPTAASEAPEWLQDALQESPAEESAAPLPAVPASSSDAPAWLQDALTTPEKRAELSMTPGSAVPDWLQDAAEQGQPEQPPSVPEAEEPEQIRSTAAQEPPPGPAAPIDATSPDNAPEWLAKVLSERTPPSLEPVPTDWGQDAGDAQHAAPEWLDDIVSGSETPAAPPSQPEQAESPIVSDEWLDEFITSSPASVAESGFLTPSELEAPSDLNALGDLEAWDVPSEAESVPPPPEDWLTQDTGLGPPSIEEPEEKSQELPDWLFAGALADAANASAEPEQPKQEEAKNELPDWLKTEPEPVLEAVSELEEEKSVAPPDDELRDGGTSPEDDVPDWLASGDLDSDDALKWLEEIAAKVDPNFKPSVVADEAAPAAAVEAAAPEPEKAEEEGELPDWLKSEAAPAAAVETAPPEAEKAEEEGELPDWLKSEAAPAAAVEAAPPEAEKAEEEGELPDWLKSEAAPELEADGLPGWLKSEAPSASPAETASKADEDLEWLREPTEAAKPEAEEEGELPDWLKSEEEKPSKEAVSEPSEALSWLDEQTAEQGVGADKVVSEALIPDHPPVPAPTLPDEKAEAKRITTGELPSWLKEANVREEMEKAMEAPSGDSEIAELPDLPVEADELAWLNETLKVEEQAASIDLDDILGEKAEEGAPAAAEEEEELPEWLKEPEPAAKAEVAAEAEAEEKELPEWLKESEPISATTEEEGLPEWLKESEPISATKAEEEPPAWLKEPETAARAEAKGVEPPAWLKESEPVFTPKAEEPEKAEAKEEELPAWLKEPEAAPVSEVGEGTEELPDWLTKSEPEPEPVAASAPEPAIVPEIKEEEGELPSWLTAPEPAAEATETDLAAFLNAVEPAAAPPVAEPAPEPVSVPVPEPAPVVASQPPAAPPAAPVAPPPPVIASGDAAAQLLAAREQKGAGELQAALSIYEGLVNAGQHLDETIADLSEIAKTQVVVNPRVYRVMGDAMMGQGRMQDALDMYRKALDQF